VNYNFNFNLFIFRKVPTFYEEIINSFFSKKIFEDNKITRENLDSDFLVIEDVPRYLKTVKKNIPNGVKFKSIKQYSGFLMNFEGVNNLEEYIKSRFGRTSRYKLRRGKKRLETCFDIAYKMYYGEILKEEYNYIFEELYRLLEIRLLEKSIINEGVIGTKEKYKELVYQMILEKEASLYVIYNSGKPIDICLNFHIKNMIFQLYRTYDIAYSKFNTGYVNLMNQIEWCIDNDIKIISFGKGSFYWKKRWCNTQYEYDYQMFYNSKSIKATIQAQLYFYKKKFKQFLREKKVIEKYHQFKKSRIQSDESKKIKSTIVAYQSHIDNVDLIDYNIEEYSFLRRNVYDFLFEFSEKEKDVALFKITATPNSYLITGKRNKKLLEISN